MFFDDTRRAEIAARLKAAAAEQNLKQTDLASEMGLTQGTVSKILRGSVKKARLYQDMASVLGIDLDEEEGSELGEVTQLSVPASRDATVMAITIEKGGSGKTTTCVNLAAVWASQGMRVLIVDLDPQGHSTLYLDQPKSGAGLIESLKTRSELSILTTPFGVDIVPGGPQLDELGVLLANARNPITCLRKVIKPLRSSYDIILIDTAPAMDLRSANAMVAADFVIIPAQAEEGALDGLAGLYSALEELREDYPHIQLLATIPTLVDKRCRTHVRNMNELKRHAHLRTTEHHIPRLIELADSFAEHEPIIHFKDSGRGARQYRLVARELLERVGQLAGAVPQAS